MLSNIETLVADKNNWLASQVDVEFPTPESIAGRALYLELQSHIQYTHSPRNTFTEKGLVDEVIEVDFHRLTILFSVLQASSLTENTEQQGLLIEFLTQIILDSEYQLYLGFKGTEPVAALMCRYIQGDKTMLFSDVMTKYEQKNSAFISDVLKHIETSSSQLEHVIHPIFA